jgi:hypothetical protein
LRKILAEYTESMPLDSSPVSSRLDVGSPRKLRPNYV